MIDLFAITDDPAPPLPTIAPLSAVASHGLALVCAPAAHVEISPEVLWRHEEVVEALMEDRDLLPVRFGTRLDDADLSPSDLIIPPPDLSLEEARELFSGEGLIPDLPV